MLADNFLSTTNVVLEQNILVLNTGDKLVLFDTGMGSSQMFGPTPGKMLANLKAAGIDPKDVDAIVATHAHCDHVWGIMGDDGKPNFPNAQIYHIAGRLRLLDGRSQAGDQGAGLHEGVRGRRAQKPASQS